LFGFLGNLKLAEIAKSPSNVIQISSDVM